MDHKEQVAKATETTPEATLQPTLQPQPTLSLSNDLPEVTESSFSTTGYIENNNSIFENVQESNNHPQQIEEPVAYKLPLRSTKGVPPKWYDPEYETQSSKYPLEEQS